MKEKDILIINHLRQNARQSLAKIAKNTSIPLSTVFDRLQKLEKNIIKKHVSLLNFSKLGYNLRVNFILKSKDKKDLKEFLLTSKSTNSVYKISNYDFYVEGIFRDMKEVEEFREILRNKAEKIDEHCIIEDLKKEGFLLGNLL